MGEKKDKKGKKARKADKGGKKAKASASKLPKRIAGVKVPKELRASGGKLVEVLRNPLLMDVAAAALIAAATGLRDGRPRNAAPATGAPPSKPAGADIGAMIATTALAGVRKLAEGAANGGKGDGTGSTTRPGRRGPAADEGSNPPQ